MAELAVEVPIDGEDLPGCVDRLASYHAANPHVLRLLMWESLERGDSGVVAESERAEHYRDKVEAVRRAQGTGTVTEAIDPGMIVVLALGTISWPLVVPQRSRLILGETKVGDLRSASREAVRRLTGPG